MNWKDSFDRRTLAQGWNLYRENRVSQLKRNGSVFSATVLDPYTQNACQVQAQIDQGNILGMNCTCPVSKINGLCAHEAAFLYALEDYPSLNSVPGDHPACANEHTPSSRPVNHEQVRHEKASVQKPQMDEEHHSLSEVAQEECQHRQFEQKEDDRQKKAPEKAASVEPPNVQGKRVGGLQGLIDSLPEDQLRRFVLSYARRNIEFREEMEMEFLDEFPDELLGMFYSGFDGLVTSYQDSFGQISRKDLPVFLNSLLSFIQARTSMLLRHEHAHEACSFLTYCCEAVLDIQLPGSDADTCEFWTQIVSLLEQAIEADDPKVLDDHIGWIEFHLDQKFQPLPFEQALESLAVRLFTSPLQARGLVSVLKEKLNEEKMTTSRGHYSPRYKELMSRIETVLHDQPELAEEKERFFEEYKGDEALESILVQEAIRQQDLEEAEIILENALKSMKPGTLNAVMKSRQLAELLLGQNRKEEAIGLLKTIVLDTDHYNSQDLIELSALLPIQEFDQLFEAVAQKNNANPLVIAQTLEKLGRTSELMALVEEKQDLLLAELFEETLMGSQGSRLAALWISRAEEEAANTSAKHYENAISYLKRAAHIPAGKEQAAEAARQIQAQYPDKKGLQHRLNASGLLDTQPKSA